MEHIMYIRTFRNQYYFKLVILLLIMLLEYLSYAISESNIYMNNDTININGNGINRNSYVPIYLNDSINNNYSANANNTILNKQHSHDFPDGNNLKNQVPFVTLSSNIDNSNNNRNDYQKTAGYNVLELVKNLDNRLKNIRNSELGVTIVQKIFDSIDFTKTVRNDSEVAVRLAKRITSKLERAMDVITQLTSIVVDNMKLIGTSDAIIILNTLIQPCPFDDYTMENTYNKQSVEMLNYLKLNDHHDGGAVNFTINANIAEEMHGLISDSTNNFKHVFYLSRFDHASDRNCECYFKDIHFRYLYAAAIQRKHLLLLIDLGYSFNSDYLDLARNFVSNIVNMMSDTDTITVVCLSDPPYTMSLENDKKMVKNFMYPTTMDNREAIIKFIWKINNTDKITNHSRGFEYAFELLHNQNLSSEITTLFIYISHGTTSGSDDIVQVLSSIAAGQQLLNKPIVINTCAVIDSDEKRYMAVKQFLRTISQQNYTKYSLNVGLWYKTIYSLQGKMFVITKRYSDRIIKISTSVFESLFLKGHLSSSIQFHLPILDYSTKDFIVSVTKTLESYGVVGVNFDLNDLAEDIIYFKNSDESYAFLIDTSGTTIFHPAFPRPIATMRNPFPVDIIYLENVKGFKQVRSAMLARKSGSLMLVNNKNSTITYTWEQIQDAYVVAVVTRAQLHGRNATQLTKISGLRYYNQANYYTSSELLYHRIDLISPQTSICRHFRQIATLDCGTVFLSASSFQSPFNYAKSNHQMKEEKRAQNAQNIMVYIRDDTNLLANPGLQQEVRNDVAALFQVLQYLKKRHQESDDFKPYIIRRYVATTNGVLQVYPGCIIGTDLEPSRRPWYRKAMKYPGKIVVTEPYLDAGGAGYIITIAHTIFEGKANALHSIEHDIPIAVIAIDLPYAFFYKLILDSTPLCSQTNMKCILLEERGYIIAHPSMLEPSTRTQNNRRPFEHITHKELFVANDILNHKVLVVKRACANYQNRTIQRYYTFNTSLTEVLTNVAHGERTKYEITAIAGTNLFAAVLNSSYEGGPFCPCSTVDRICLNCNRMEQTDCECPCECPLHIPSRFTDNNVKEEALVLINSTEPLSYCEPQSESLSTVSTLSYDWDMGLKSCVNINCDSYVSHNDCIGVMGCEWCQLDIDGSTFAAPFCATQNTCFNGVFGSMAPYGDGDLGQTIVEPIIPPAYSAIGPVGGAIVALCLVVGFAMYCYKQNLDNGSEQLYAESMQEENYGVPLSRFNFDDISPHDDSDLSGGGTNVMHRNLLHPFANAIAIPDISPYHMSSGGYRRPNGESDHGYSTMTPHEDSEHMCFTLVEPLIDNKRLSMSDSMSINTSVSSPTNHSQLHGADNSPQPSNSYYLKQNYTSGMMSGQTVLPESISPHHILAPVTVHRHMEGS